MKIQRQIYSWNNNWGLYILERDSSGLIWRYQPNTCNQDLSGSGYPALHFDKAWDRIYPFREEHLSGDS